MAEKKYFDIKNDIYQKEVIAKLRKEVSELIKENEYLRNRVKDLEEIKYKDWLYEFKKNCNDYVCSYDSLLDRENEDVKQFLNDEIEIIEESKKITKKIKSYYDVGLQENCIYEEGNKKNNAILGEPNSWELIIDKINEIIDKINGDE